MTEPAPIRRRDESLASNSPRTVREDIVPQVQLGAVSGCSLFASTLGFGSFTMFFNWRLIHSSIGKL